MIDRREALGSIAATLVGAPAVLRRRFTVFGQGSTEYSARAVTLMEEATVVDLLNQFMFAHQVKEGLPKLVRWMTQSGAFTPADADLFRSSGIHVFCLGSGVSSDSTWAVRFFADWNSFIAAYPEYLLRVDDSSDFERARRERKIGIMLTSQESGHLKTREDVDLFFSLGQRVSQLTYNYANQLGSGFLETRDGGLTALGQSILTRMEAVGMAVDLSHCGDQTTLDALGAARRPVLFTHASCRTLMSGHLRTKTDEMIRRMAATGGLIGIPFIRFLVRDREPVDMGHALDHFDYVRKLVGVEHLAVGSDVDVTGNAAAQTVGPSTIPLTGPSQPTPNAERLREHRDPADPRAGISGLNHPRRMLDLTEGLLGRGYSVTDVKMILGGNATRVFTALWSRPDAR